MRSTRARIPGARAWRALDPRCRERARRARGGRAAAAATAAGRRGGRHSRRSPATRKAPPRVDSGDPDPDRLHSPAPRRRREEGGRHVPHLARSSPSSSLATARAHADTGSSLGDHGGEGSTPFTGLAQAPEANLFTGSLTTAIPLELPPGRARHDAAVGACSTRAAAVRARSATAGICRSAASSAARRGGRRAAADRTPTTSCWSCRPDAAELVRESGGSTYYRPKVEEAWIRAEKRVAENQWSRRRPQRAHLHLRRRRLGARRHQHAGDVHGAGGRRRCDFTAGLGAHAGSRIRTATPSTSRWSKDPQHPLSRHRPLGGNTPRRRPARLRRALPARVAPGAGSPGQLSPRRGGRAWCGASTRSTSSSTRPAPARRCAATTLHYDDARRRATNRCSRRWASPAARRNTSSTRPASAGTRRDATDRPPAGRLRRAARRQRQPRGVAERARHERRRHARPGAQRRRAGELVGRVLRRGRRDRRLRLPEHRPSPGRRPATGRTCATSWWRSGVQRHGWSLHAGRHPRHHRRRHPRPRRRLEPHHLGRVIPAAACRSGGSALPITWPAPNRRYIRRSKNGDTYQDLVDMNGDGLPDLVVSGTPGQQRPVSMARLPQHRRRLRGRARCRRGRRRSAPRRPRPQRHRRRR